jgi:putative transcriptional regulator
MTTIYSRTLADGSSVQEMPDGSTRPMPPDRRDWARLEAMTDEEITANALSDPDNPPLTPEQRARMRPVSAAKRLRWRLGLTQAAFAERYRIPLDTLREWEQPRTEFD